MACTDYCLTEETYKGEPAFISKKCDDLSDATNFGDNCSQFFPNGNLIQALAT